MRQNMSEIARTLGRSHEGAGRVSGSDFPNGTTVGFSSSKGTDSLVIFCKGGSNYTVTKDKVRHAEILAMGIIGTKPKGTESVECFGIKYRIETTDGKVAIITIEASEAQYKIENIIF